MINKEIKMTDIMLDIETLGIDSNSIIVSISAVKFNFKTGEIGDKFDIGLDVLEQMLNGSVVDMNTLRWWTDQDKMAKQSLLDIKKDSVSYALNLFNSFVEGNYKLWGNGSSFDNVIVENLMKRMSIKFNINFWDYRDVRTLVDLSKINTKTYKFEGIKHNGLEDCMHQIKYCMDAYNIISKDA